MADNESIIVDGDAEGRGPSDQNSVEKLVNETDMNESYESAEWNLIEKKLELNTSNDLESAINVEDELFDDDKSSQEPADEAKGSDTDLIEIIDDLRNNANQGENVQVHEDNILEVTPMKMGGCWNIFTESTANNNFLKGCKWAPDGLCVLTNSDDNVLRLFNIPDSNYTRSNWDLFNEELFPVLSMKESGTIYDFCWYPNMDSSDPATCCLVSTSRLNPIHLWDAYTGEIRCTYKSYNNVDQLVSAVSIAFSGDGQKLYAGFNKSIRIFDVCTPGRIYTEMNLKSSGVQMGIISCIANDPNDPCIFAAGSYSKSIGIFDTSVGKETMILAGQNGGVTHVMFSLDGTRLYSGGRKDDEILCWDLRKPGETLYVLKRKVSTNQKIYFDMDKSGKYLISGNTEEVKYRDRAPYGYVSVWDTTSAVKYTITGQKRLARKLHFETHKDCVNGVSFNPKFPMIATTSGQRKFPVIDDNLSDEDDEKLFSNKNICFDNSLVLWWTAKGNI